MCVYTHSADHLDIKLPVLCTRFTHLSYMYTFINVNCHDNPHLTKILEIVLLNISTDTKEKRRERRVRADTIHFLLRSCAEKCFPPTHTLSHTHIWNKCEFT